jgi:kynurenine formamidase
MKNQEEIEVLNTNSEMNEKESILAEMEDVTVTKKVKIIDLSVTLDNTLKQTWPPEITYFDHQEVIKIRGAKLGLKPEDYPDGAALAMEKINLVSHAGTHLDAPFHFGPRSEGKPSKTIEQIPLEWCYSDGVVLDLRHKKEGESISLEDIQEALRKIKYRIKPYDIVLIMTGADKFLDDPNYADLNPGMSSEATLWLIEQGVKVMGIDGWGFDKGATHMVKEFKAGNKKALWPSHVAGRQKEYCHIEQLANLDKIPKPYGFKVAVFPIKIARASAGWARAVAILEE